MHNPRMIQSQPDEQVLPARIPDRCTVNRDHAPHQSERSKGLLPALESCAVEVGDFDVEVRVVVPDLEGFAPDRFAGLEEWWAGVACGCDFYDCFVGIRLGEGVIVDGFHDLRGEGFEDAACGFGV